MKKIAATALCILLALSVMVSIVYKVLPVDVYADASIQVDTYGMSGGYDQGFTCNGSGSLTLSVPGIESISFSLYAGVPLYAAPAAEGSPGPYVLGDSPSAAGSASTPVYVSDGTLWVNAGSWLEAVYDDENYFETFFIDTGTSPSSPTAYPLAMRAESDAGSSDISFSLGGSGDSYFVSATLPLDATGVTLTVVTPDAFRTTSGGTMPNERDPRLSLTGLDVQYTLPEASVAPPPSSSSSSSSSSLPPSSRSASSKSSSKSSGSKSSASSKSSSSQASSQKESSSTSRTYSKPSASSQKASLASSSEVSLSSFSSSTVVPLTINSSSESPSSSEMGYIYWADSETATTAASHFGFLYLILAAFALVVIIFHKQIIRFCKAVRKAMKMMDDPPSDS